PPPLMFRAPVPMTLLYEDGHVTELVEAQRPVNVGVTKACCTELIASSSDNPVVSTSSPVLTMHALSARATIAPDAHRTVVVMPFLHLFPVFDRLPKLGAIRESHIVFGEGASSAIASLTLGRLRVHVHASGDR